MIMIRSLVRRSGDQRKPDCRRRRRFPVEPPGPGLGGSGGAAAVTDHAGRELLAGPRSAERAATRHLRAHPVAAQHTGSARARLARLVAEVVPEDSKVLIRQRVVQGRPGAELVALSEHAALLVVGAPGHGTIAGAVLGSVSQHVLAHSACTVVVVR